LLAVIEVQIEGKNGWVANLPAWRPKTGSRLQIWWLKLFKKDLTGYHLSLMPFLLLSFHLPFIWGVPWSWLAELEVLAFLVFFAVFWDFFVVCPKPSLFFARVWA